MSSLDISLLNKSILPSVEFKEIDLDLSPIPFLEDNPHIDHDREKGIITEKDRNGRRRAKKALPRMKAAFNEFDNDGSKSDRIGHLLHLRKLKVNFRLSLKDKLVRNKGTWSSVDDFVGSLKIKVIMCTDEKLFNRISRNENLVNNESTNSQKLKDSGVLQLKIIDGRSFINKKNYNVISAGGPTAAGKPGATKLIDYTFDSFFVAPSSTPSFLGLITYCYFDKKDFQQRLGLDLKTSFIKEQYFGPMAKEVIIDSNGIKNSGVAFLDKNNKAFAGAVYRNSKGEYTTGQAINNKKIASQAQGLLDTWTQKDPATPGGKYYNDLKKSISDSKSENLLNTMMKVSSMWSGQETDPIATGYKKDLNKTIRMLRNIEKGEKKITAVTVPNSKLVDNRASGFLQSKKTIKKPRSLQEQMLKKLKIKSKGSDGLVLPYPKHTNYSSFTPLFDDIDQYSNVNLMFGINFDDLCKDNSRYWSLFEGKNKELVSEFLDNFKIISMQIKRRNIITPKEPDSLIANLRERYPKQKMSFINDSPNSYKTRVLYKNPAIAQELDIRVPDTAGTEQLRFFHIKDFLSPEAKSSNTPGLYEYEMDITMQDNSRKYLDKKLKRLLSAIKMLEQYLNQAEQKCNFDSASNSFTDLFLSNIYGAYKEPSPNNILNTANYNDVLTTTKTLIDAPWIVAPAIYASTNYQFTDNNMLDIFKQSRRLYRLLEPSLSTPRKIRKTIEQFEKLAFQIREDLGPLPGNSTNNSGPGITKSRKSLQRIQITHKFRNKVYKGKTNNFKSFLDFSSPTSPPIITYEGYLSRVNNETETLIESDSVNLSSFGTDEFSSAFTSLSETKFSFLSPSSYSTPNIKVNTNIGSAAKKQDKEIYSALFNEISNINLSVDKDIRQVVAPTNKKGLTYQNSLIKNQALNSQNMLSKFNVTLIDDPNDDIALDIIPRLLNLLPEEEDGLVPARRYFKKNKTFDQTSRFKSISTIQQDSKIEDIKKTNMVHITNSIVGKIAMGGFNRQNKMSVGAGGLKNAFNPSSADSAEANIKVLSLQSYDLSNSDNIFNNLNLSPQKIRKLPNHIKALALKNKSVAGTDEPGLDIDVLASPELQPYYIMKHFDVAEVKVLSGFHRDKDSGRLFLNAPIYKTLDAAAFQNTNGSLLCKLQQYTLPFIGSSPAAPVEMNVANSNFIIGSKPKISKENEKIKVGHSSGGELFYKNGVEYVGFFHRRKNGTIFSKRSPTKQTKEQEGSQELFAIEKGLARRQAYMMKMNDKAKYGSSSHIERQIKAELLNAANKQKIVPKEYVRTTDINMSSKLISTTTGRRSKKPTISPQSAIGARGPISNKKASTRSTWRPKGRGPGGSGY
tara:strand:+ start:2157 stop:6221 length:4065 start_codon:yes stop_codon:yes gene_type:complete